MNNPIVAPPAGYTLFATHAANGWAFWVPPLAMGSSTCLQQYQFINTNGMIGKYGPVPCASMGQAMQDPDKPYSVYAFDVENDFSPYGNDPTQPYIPQMVAMWCTYVVSIAAHFGWTQIEIGDVTKEGFRALLSSLGFQGDARENYVGIMTTIAPITTARCTGVGWVFAPAAAVPQQNAAGAGVAPVVVNQN